MQVNSCLAIDGEVICSLLRAIATFSPLVAARRRPYCIAMANHYITTQSQTPPYRVSAMLFPCGSPDSCLRSPFDPTLETWGRQQNPCLHSSRSLLLKPIPFTGGTPPLHTLPAYEPTCASVLSGHIGSLVATQTRSRRCHYVPRPTAVDCFALPQPVSQ